MSSFNARANKEDAESHMHHYKRSHFTHGHQSKWQRTLQTAISHRKKPANMAGRGGKEVQKGRGHSALRAAVRLKTGSVTVTQ